MEACLLHNISHREYLEAVALPLHHCEVIAVLADLKISFTDAPRPGELLVKTLDLRGFTAQKYKELLKMAQSSKMIRTFYKPQAKVAILIANDKYTHLSKLVTPSLDCDSLRTNLRNLGFVVVTVKNSTSKDIKVILERIFEVIPEKSYCFIFYAGHGCELCNTKCLLDINCPTENITTEHCVTENYVLKEVAKCKPELCVLIMDMCRIQLDRPANPQLYASLPSIDIEYQIDNIANLLISYSTQSAQAAYEVLQIECSTTIDNNITYELRTGDSEKIVPGASQYVNALCMRFADDLDVSSMIDKVHGDVENAMKRQRPIKVQCGVAKRSLYDPVKGDTEELLNKLKEIGEQHSDNCSVF